MISFFVKKVNFNILKKNQINIFLIVMQISCNEENIKKYKGNFKK